jgi:photosystem II stability/assembly factor-like uncharacterized protein
MTTRLLLTALVLILTATTAGAQQALESLARRDSVAPTFPEMQRAFEEWSHGRDLRKERGWKWYKRWESFTEQRALPGGRIADAATYWQGAMQALAAKGSAELASSGPGWMPVGPSALAKTSDPTFVKGIGRINCITFHPSDSNTFWVGVAQGGVWKTVDGGVTWRPLTDNLPILRISDIAVDPTNADVMYISVGDYAYLGVNLTSTDRKRHSHYGMGVFKTTDGGASWSPTGLSFALTAFDGSLIRRVFVDPATPSNLLALGTSGTWTSSDAGATWKQGLTSLIWDAERHPSSPRVIYATTGYLALFGTGNASLIKSTDFGVTWTTMPSGIPPRMVQRIEMAIAPSDPNYVYAVASNTVGGLYGVYRSTDAGATWSAQARPPAALNILGWDGGEQGTGRGQGSYDLAITVDPRNRERVFVGGINVWGSEDGGVTWDGVTYWIGAYGPGVHADQHMLAVNPHTGAYYLCNDGGLHTTPEIEIGRWSDAVSIPDYAWPTTWRNITSGMAITSFYRLGLSRDNPGYVVAGAQDNGTFYFNGEEWRQLFGGDGMDCFIDHSDPGLVYGSSQFGYLHVTPDGGESERPSVSDQIMNNYGDEGEWTTPFAIDPQDRTTLYAGFGNLYRSQGDDETWTPISDFPKPAGATLSSPITALAISPANPSYIYLGKKPWYTREQPSALWMTSDGGVTWHNITAGAPDSLYITSIATHRTDVSTAWVTFGGFSDGVKVYRTTDAGATWTNISSDLPNLPANAIVHDAGGRANTVYVGTDIGVYYTNDEMNGWRPFMQNLPNVIVSDLEIHPATREIYAGTFGRGIWMSELPAPAAADDAVAASGIDVRVSAGEGAGTIVVEIANAGGDPRATVAIVDVLGRRVAERSIEVSPASHRAVLDVALPEGLYFVQVAHAHGTRVVRHVVEG